MSASLAFVLQALLLYAATTQAQTAGRAGPLDPSKVLAKEVSLISNSVPGEPMCTTASSAKMRMTFKPLRKAAKGLASEQILFNGKPCASGSTFIFKGSSPTGEVKKDGFSLALSFLSGEFRAPSSGGDDAGTSPPDSLDILTTVLRDGDPAVKCGILTIRRFLVMQPKKNFTMPAPVQNTGSDRRVVLEPKQLYFGLDVVAKNSPAANPGNVGGHLALDPELCLFGQIKTNRETVATGARDKTGNGEKESPPGSTPVAGIAAGVGGVVLGLSVIVVAAFFWRRRHVHVSEERLADDFSVASSQEMSPI